MRFPWQKKSVPVEAVMDGGDKAGPAYSFQIVSLSETGPTRNSNEDSIIFFHPGNDPQTVFAMVADGMGGHNAGEVASNMACRSAHEFLEANYLRTDISALLGDMVQHMHRSIREASRQNPGYQGMGTTATAVYIRQGRLYFAHVGDSRLYRYVNGDLVQCTTDQTLVNQMIKEGKLTQAQAEHHDMKHVLMQALGTVETIVPEVSASSSAIHPGEYYFICSDGIYDALTVTDLKSMLAMQEPALVMESIKALCYQRQARDNFSAILVAISDKLPVQNNGATREQNIMS